MSNIGRISGPLLKSNLERKGIDLVFDNDLLYLDVQNRTIGVKKATALANVALDIDSGYTTSIITDNDVSVGPLGDQVHVNTNSTITNDSGSITFSSPLGIITPSISTDNLEFRNSDIISLNPNSDILFYPTGRMNVNGTTNVGGSVHVQGNVLYFTRTVYDPLPQGEVDDLPSDVKPAVDNTGLVGNGPGVGTYQWQDGYFKSVYSNSISLPTVPPGLAVETTKPGHSYYVSTNGSDTLTGDFQTSPFRTLRKALSIATAGDTIFIYPGTYLETFPLTVPVGVTVRGEDIRTVRIQPTPFTVTQDAFLLNGETLVEDLTISGFRFNSVANTGYGFKFAPNFKVTTKSPYVKNVSVITTGSTVTQADPLGYDSRNAGCGAYIDGSVANSTSIQASMLFYGVTFITPGVNALTMCNGVRVEWLNSFTYYAERGMYAFNGSTGFNGKFGAEVRSISSANVYGNYAAYGDGASVLMYLVGHNFAYVGSGKDTSNDNTLIVQSNEVVELNNAKILFNSTDQKGDFRVGDAFSVNFKTGNTSFNSNAFDLTGLSVITLTSGTGDTAILTPSSITDKNFKISGSTIETLSGPMNIVTATGSFLLNDNVNVAKDLSVTGNVVLKGAITIGNDTSDTASFAMPLDQDIVPNSTNVYTLGNTVNRWARLYANQIKFVSMSVDNNTLTALNTNLNFLGNGTAGVLVDGVTFKNNIISTPANVNLKFKPKPFTNGNMFIDSNISMRLPVGTTANRLVLTQGDLRFNTTDNVFEGYGSTRKTLGGSYSTDRLTKVVAHPTNNTINFTVNGVQRASVIPGGFSVTSFLVDSFSIANNVISTAGTTDFIISTLGTANIDVNGITIDGNSIVNNSSDPLIFAGTGNSGTFKLASNTGVIIPVVATTIGSTPNPVTGDIRYNDELQYAEVYNEDLGRYDRFSGVGDVATSGDVEDYTTLWSLILG